MASSMSGQDQSNPLLRLAKRARKMELPVSCPLGIMASFFFGEFMDLNSISVQKHIKKELGHYPAILTSHLVNNPFFRGGG